MMTKYFKGTEPGSANDHQATHRNVRRRARLLILAVGAWCSVASISTSAQAVCVGDCDGSDDVTVNEIITLVNMALGSQTQLSACASGLPADITDPSQVDVSLIIQAVNNALAGCSAPPTVTPTMAPTFRPTVTATPTTATLVGTWVLGDPSVTTQPLVAVVFIDRSHYLLMQQGSDPPDPSGHDGFEQGTYTWNPATGEFQIQIQVDNNGEWGFSNPGGAMTIHLDGDQLTYSDGTSTSVATRLTAQPGDPLVGSWVAGPDDGSPGLAVLTFFDSAHYMFALQGGGGPGGYSGIERGTYTWDQPTGAFSAAVAVDTNGEWGFSDPTGPITVGVTDTTLTVSIVGADGTHTAVRVPSFSTSPAAPSATVTPLGGCLCSSCYECSHCNLDPSSPDWFTCNGFCDDCVSNCADDPCNPYRYR
jgi:hypothetical protein